MNTCDIIIPNYNSLPALTLCLKALSRQEIPPTWQLKLMIVDDGSVPNHKPQLSDIQKHYFSPTWQPPLIIHTPHAGAASARNTALARSHADIVVFLGSDIILRPKALAAHLKLHQDRPRPTTLGLGFISWDPALHPSPLMEWMTHGGSQNNFDDLLGIVATQSLSKYYYGSFLSGRREFLKRHPFPEIYKTYGWEDLHLGRLLEASAATLYPLPTAIGHHHHFYTAANIMARSRQIGRSLVQYQAAFPTAPLITPSPHTARNVFIYRYTGLGLVMRLLFRACAPSRSLPRLFLLVTAAEQWVGVYQESSGKQLSNKNTKQRQ